MAGRSDVADPDCVRVGIRGNFEIVFDLVTCRKKHKIDSWINGRIPDALKMRCGSPCIGHAKVVSCLTLRLGLAMRLRSRIGACKVDVRLAPTFPSDRNLSTGPQRHDGRRTTPVIPRRAVSKSFLEACRRLQELAGQWAALGMYRDCPNTNEGEDGTAMRRVHQSRDTSLHYWRCGIPRQEISRSQISYAGRCKH